MKHLPINHINHTGIGIVGIGYPSPFIFRGKKIIFISVFMHSCKTIPNTIKHDSGRNNIIKLRTFKMIAYTVPKVVQTNFFY